MKKFFGLVVLAVLVVAGVTADLVGAVMRDTHILGSAILWVGFVSIAVVGLCVAAQEYAANAREDEL